jgi:predicted metal-binding membrane protein
VAEQGGVRRHGEVQQLKRAAGILPAFRRMPASTLSLQSLLNRDRRIIFAALALTTALAWGYMVHEARAMMRTGVCECMGMAMAGPDTREWSATQWLALFLMWAEMMIAMMLPSVAPMILTFASVNRSRREQERPFVPTTFFALGYFILWSAFSLLATAAQWALHSASLLSPMMIATSPWIAGGLLIGAGVFQFTPWKHACLSHCANPLGFLLTQWREGKRGALIMGVRHGAFCLGCCWLLMLVLFAVGVMNVTWIALLTIYVLAEKLLGQNVWFGRIAGAALCGWGIVVIVRAW